MFAKTCIVLAAFTKQIPFKECLHQLAVRIRLWWSTCRCSKLAPTQIISNRCSVLISGHSQWEQATSLLCPVRCLEVCVVSELLPAFRGPAPSSFYEKNPQFLGKTHQNACMYIYKKTTKSHVRTPLAQGTGVTSKPLSAFRLHRQAKDKEKTVEWREDGRRGEKNEESVATTHGEQWVRKHRFRRWIRNVEMRPMLEGKQK